MSCVRFVIWWDDSTHANLDSIQKILPLSLLFPNGGVPYFFPKAVQIVDGYHFVERGYGGNMNCRVE